MFEAHILMLQDPELDKTIRQGITEDKRHPAYSVNQTRKIFMEMMLAIEDPYLRKEQRILTRSVHDSLKGFYTLKMWI